MPHPPPDPSALPLPSKTTVSTGSESPILTPPSPALSQSHAEQQHPRPGTAMQPDTNTPQDDGSPPEEAAVPEVKEDGDKVAVPETKKVVCTKHHMKKKSKKSKKDDSDSENDGDDESSDDDSSDSSSDSGPSDDEKEKKKKKTKRKLKEKKKKRKAESSDEESSSSSDESSEEDKKKRKKSKKKRKAESSDEESSSSSDDSSEEEDKKKRKKSKKKKKDSDEEDEKSQEQQLREEIRAAQQKLLTLQLNGGRRRTIRPAKTQTDQKKGKKGKKGSKVAFKRVDQLWDNSIHNYKLTETVEDPDADEYDQYIFTVRRKFDWENKYTDTVVDIKSKPLRDALQHVMEGVKGVSLVQETPVVDPNMLFLYLEETREYMAQLKQLAKTEKKKKARRLAKTKADHLKVLVKYLDKDYAETKKTLYPLLESKTITFDLLWALFKPNTIAYTPTYGNHDEARAFKIEYATKESSFMRGQWYSIEGRYLEYDGKSFGMGTMAADVDTFKGPRKISSLACYPIQYHHDYENLSAKLIERGKKFVSLQGMNYKFHKGMAFVKKRRSVLKVNINGRVMVDPALHRRINPNYQVSVVRPKDPDGLGRDSDEEDSDCCCAGSEHESEAASNEAPRSKLKFVQDKQGKMHLVEIEYDENGNEIYKEDIDELSTSTESLEFNEEDLLIASPVVLGFAFNEKLWLEFTVSGISDIDWNTGAFDSLVLPNNQKSIVKALVESHTFRAAENIDDVIQGKGKGLVAVLHGPPGTGKTLTAEGIAELLKRPLYMVSAGELGTDSRTLELELNKILDIAHSWGAVLLLDEADVFLEKRTIQDIHRNALVSIFLRLLEYFQGILFLTTNRVETFDDAFQSRIHVALRYGDLTTKAKRSVWKMFLEKVMQQAAESGETVSFSEEDYNKLARHALNGRQIKNSVRTAQALALNEKAPLSMDHIARVLDVAETFDRDLRGGSGYEDAMRSYT